MLLYRLNSKVVNLPHVASTYNKLNNLGKRDSLPITTVLNNRRKGVVVYRV
jgi:hypothetical protein